MTKRRLVVPALACLTGGLLATSGSATIGSGLHGHVTKGPIKPVCVAGDPCDGPASGVVLVFSRNGREIGRAKTGLAGGYRVRLRPGRYGVRLQDSPKIGRGLSPKVATVRSGHFSRVDFSFDTGIR